MSTPPFVRMIYNIGNKVRDISIIGCVLVSAFSSSLIVKGNRVHGD